jgi:pilus assembly protein Flp/PilA
MPPKDFEEAWDMRMIIGRFWQSADGATAIEYGLIAGLIAVAIIGGAGVLGGNLNNTFSWVANKVSATPQ